MNLHEIIADVVIASMSASVGFAYCANALVAPRIARIASLKNDLEHAGGALADLKESLYCRDQALAAHMEYVSTLRQKIAKWVPTRNAKGHFVSKAH